WNNSGRHMSLTGSCRSRLQCRIYHAEARSLSHRKPAKRRAIAGSMIAAAARAVPAVTTVGAPAVPAAATAGGVQAAATQADRATAAAAGIERWPRMLPDKTKKLLEEMEQQQRDREHSINSALSNIDRLLDK